MKPYPRSSVMSRSQTQSKAQHICRACPTASKADLFGRYPYEAGRNSDSTTASVDSSRPFARFHPRPSESLTSSLRHSLSGSSPSALAAESNSRKTSDSRFYRGSSSSPFQTPRSTAHPGLPPLDCSLPLNRLPRLPIGKYKTVLLHPSGSSPCGLTQPMSLHYTHPLRSVGFRRLHRRLRLIHSGKTSPETSS